MYDRTSLAIEVAKQVKSHSGIRTASRKIGGIEITDTRVSEAGRKYGLGSGRYISIETSPKAEVVCALLKHGLEQLIPPCGTVLVVGIGNADITQDSLGSKVVSMLSPNDGGQYDMRVFSVAVSAKTGVDTADMVRAAVEAAGADFVVVVDSLACGEVGRIGGTIQLTDAGIVPGAGASDAKGELSETSIGVPCIAVGVPTVAELASVTGKKQHKGMLVSTADCDIMVQLWAEVIASAFSASFK